MPYQPNHPVMTPEVEQKIITHLSKLRHTKEELEASRRANLPMPHFEKQVDTHINDLEAIHKEYYSRNQ